MAKQTVSDIRKLKDKKLYLLLRTVYLHYINAFVLSGLFYFSDKFLHFSSGKTSVEKTSRPNYKN